MPADVKIVSFRLPADEYDALERAAEAAGQSISEFVRDAVAVHTRGGAPVRLMPNTSYMAPYTHVDVTVPPQTSEAPRTIVQDEYVRQR